MKPLHRQCSNRALSVFLKSLMIQLRWHVITVTIAISISQSGDTVQSSWRSSPLLELIISFLERIERCGSRANSLPVIFLLSSMLVLLGSSKVFFFREVLAVSCTLGPRWFITSQCYNNASAWFTRLLDLHHYSGFTGRIRHDLERRDFQNNWPRGAEKLNWNW